MTSKRYLYAMGEPLGECVTRQELDRVVCGGGGGGGSTITTPTIAEELKPLANLYTQQATKLAQTPWQSYQGQRFADLNPQQMLGLGMVQERALQGSPLISEAEKSLTQTIQGGNTNPYLDQMVNKAQQSVLGNANAAAVRSGSFGNSGIGEQAARQMSDVATSMYGQAYDQDRARQLQAIGMAPTLADQGYKDASQLLNAGNILQNQQQQKLDFGYDQFKDAQNYPFKQLQTIGGVVGQAQGSQSTTSGGGK
jgi:hypothetical protein